MDGFKNRLTGRYDRNEKTAPKDNRFERAVDNRYDRSPRSNITVEAISQAIDKSNRAQTDELAELIKGSANGETGNVVINRDDVEIFSRIERMAGKNSEAISENEEVLERAYEMLRSQADVLKTIGSNIDSIKSSQDKPEEEQSEDVNAKVLEAISDNRTLLNLIRQELHSKEDESKTVNSLDVDTANKQFHDLTDHVHIQCVKTFRNVQANLNDQTAEIGKQVKDANSKLYTFLIASVGLNLVTLILVICEILHVFG